MSVDQVGIDVRVRLVSSRINGSQIIRLYGCRVRFAQFCNLHYLMALFSRTEAASGAISGSFVRLDVRDESESKNRSCEIRAEAVVDGFFDSFSR